MKKLTYEDKRKLRAQIQLFKTLWDYVPMELKPQAMALATELTNYITELRKITPISAVTVGGALSFMQGGMIQAALDNEDASDKLDTSMN